MSYFIIHTCLRRLPSILQTFNNKILFNHTSRILLITSLLFSPFIYAQELAASCLFNATVIVDDNNHIPPMAYGDNLIIEARFNLETKIGNLSVKHETKGEYTLIISDITIQRSASGDEIAFILDHARGDLGGIVRNGNGGGELVFRSTREILDSDDLPVDIGVWNQFQGDRHLSLPNPKGPDFNDPRLIGSFGVIAGYCGNPNKLGLLNVKDYGAVGDGLHDDTPAIKSAIQASSIGGSVFFPLGNYLVTEELSITKPLQLFGVGVGSQIFQQTDGKNLFILNNIRSAVIKDMYLGSASVATGTSLIKLINSHHTRIDNIILAGSYYGIHLQGSLLNTLIDIKSYVNIGYFFTKVSSNQYWVYAERYNSISANANTFIAPSLEGGENGIHIRDGRGQGSIFLYRGTIEGVNGYAIYAEGTNLPSIVSGTHMEGNKSGDVVLNGSANFRIESVYSDHMIKLDGALWNTVIDNSMVHKIIVGADAVRTRINGVATKFNPKISNGGIHDLTTDTIYQSTSGVNALDWFGTVGVGKANPSTNPSGTTKRLKVDVNGVIRADNVSTPFLSLGNNSEWVLETDINGIIATSKNRSMRLNLTTANEINSVIERLNELEHRLQMIEKPESQK